LFRTERPFKKMRTSDFVSSNGQKHHVEILCDGQQLAVFGLHPETGRQYEWPHGKPGDIKQSELPLLTEAMASQIIADAASVMIAAGWQEEKSVAKPGTANGAGCSAPVTDAGLRQRHYAKAALHGCAAELAGTPEGGRNDALNAKAFRLGTMVARGWIARDQTSDELMSAARACGLDEVEARRTCKSGLDAGEKHPHADLQERNGIGDEALEQSADAVEPPASAALLSNFVFVSDEGASPQKMLIEGVMPVEGLPFIGGQSSAGKTFIAILIAVCAASLKPFFGRTVTERVGTVIVAAEGKGMLRARIAAALIELGIDAELPIAWVKQVPDFSRPEGVQRFVNELQAISGHFKTTFGVRLGLVFVDTVSASFDIKEEADNAEAARVCKVMRRLGEATNALVVPIHHYGKNAGVGLRGASAWRANADFVLSVMADIDPQTGDVSNRQLAIAKDRDGAQGPLKPFSLKSVALGTDEDGKPWGSMVAVAEASTAKPASNWPPSLSVFRQALLTALNDSAFDDRPFADGPRVRVADVERVKSEFARICHVESKTKEGRQEALRKQFTRKLNDAQQRTLIGVRVAPGADIARTLVWLVSRNP
jgi:AAA domain